MSAGNPIQFQLCYYFFDDFGCEDHKNSFRPNRYRHLPFHSTVIHNIKQKYLQYTDSVFICNIVFADISMTSVFKFESFVQIVAFYSHSQVVTLKLNLQKFVNIPYKIILWWWFKYYLDTLFYFHPFLFPSQWCASYRASKCTSLGYHLSVPILLPTFAANLKIDDPAATGYQ